MSYPQSDSTSSDIQKSLFKAGIVSFNDDFNSIETNREQEEIIRFNSIVKSNGIVSESRNTDNVNLLPSVVTGNQISISAGTGYTRNGARIYLPLPLSVLDVTTLPNYTTPTSTKYVYIALRKVVEEYQYRTHPITGSSVSTRQRIKNDNSIVECYVYDTLSREEIIDGDILILGRILTVSPVTFDLTEKDGLRKILRTTEDKAVEVSGADMEGNLNMQNKYNVTNQPQFASSNYTLEGGTHNRDFTRLFSRINYTLATLRGLKFKQSTGNWGIEFDNSYSVKISIIPSQRPPKQININSRNSFLSIPENNILYVQLTDTDVLLTSGQSTITIQLDSRDPNNFFKVTNFLNTSNIGNNENSSLLRFPIAYHFVDPISNERKLIFANGVVLNTDEEIDSSGKHSGYLRRDGGNVMIGDLTIEKFNATIFLRRSANPSINTKSGITWTNNTGEIINGRLTRLNSLIETESSTSDTVGDVHLDVYNNTGTLGKKFIFKLDGKIVVPTAPSEDNDVVRLLELNNTYNNLNNLKYDKIGGLISGDVGISGNLDTTGNVNIQGLSRFNDTISIKQNVTNPTPEALYSKLIVDSITPVSLGFNTMAYLRGYEGLPNDVALVNNSSVSSLNSSTGELIGETLPYTIMSIIVPDVISTYGSILMSCTLNVRCDVPLGGVIQGGLRSPAGNILQYFYIHETPHPTEQIYTTISFTKILKNSINGIFDLNGTYTLEFLILNGNSVEVVGSVNTEGVSPDTHMEYCILT